MLLPAELLSSSIIYFSFFIFCSFHLLLFLQDRGSSQCWLTGVFWASRRAWTRVCVVVQKWYLFRCTPCACTPISLRITVQRQKRYIFQLLLSVVLFFFSRNDHLGNAKQHAGSPKTQRGRAFWVGSRHHFFRKFFFLVCPLCFASGFFLMFAATWFEFFCVNVDFTLVTIWSRARSSSTSMASSQKRCFSAKVHTLDTHVHANRTKKMVLWSRKHRQFTVFLFPHFHLCLLPRRLHDRSR